MRRILIVALFYLIVLSLQVDALTLLVPKCVFPTQFTCSDWEITNDTIYIKLINGGGMDVEINRILINGTSVKGDCLWEQTVEIKASESADFTIPCILDTGTISNYRKYSMYLDYRYIGTQINRTLYGEIGSRAYHKEYEAKMRQKQRFDILIFTTLFILAHLIIIFSVRFFLPRIPKEHLIGDAIAGIIVAIGLLFGFLVCGIFFGTVLRYIFYLIKIEVSEYYLLLTMLIGPIIDLIFMKIKKPAQREYYYALPMAIFYLILFLIFYTSFNP